MVASVAKVLLSVLKMFLSTAIECMLYNAHILERHVNFFLSFSSTLLQKFREIITTNNYTTLRVCVCAFMCL